MSEVTTTPSTLTIGIDLGDRKSHVCVLDADGAVVEESRTVDGPLGAGQERELSMEGMVRGLAGGWSGVQLVVTPDWTDLIRESNESNNQRIVDLSGIGL